MKTVLGVGMIVLALVLATAPAFTDNESQGKMLTIVASIALFVIAREPELRSAPAAAV
jgi:hypothetical protein